MANERDILPRMAQHKRGAQGGTKKANERDMLQINTKTQFSR